MIQRKAGKHWRKVASRKVAAGQIFQTSVRLRGRQKLRAKIGGEQSLVWNQH